MNILLLLYYVLLLMLSKCRKLILSGRLCLISTNCTNMKEKARGRNRIREKIQKPTVKFNNNIMFVPRVVFRHINILNIYIPKAEKSRKIQIAYAV